MKQSLLIGLVILAVSTLVVGPRQEGFTLAAGSSNEDLLPEITNCTIQNGIPYAPDTSPHHKMNAYLPVGNGPFPVFVYIHGGGWVGGSRDEYEDIGPFYAKRGIAGFSIDYTLATQNKSSWPVAIQDVIRAIRYIRENAQQYRIDPERIALMGDSAGGHLASLAGSLSGNEAFLEGTSGNPAVSSRVSLVVDYYGPTDFQFVGEYEQDSITYYIITSFLGGVQYWMNQSLWIEASPATYIAADDPVFVIVHGTNDTTVPITISESFKAKLEAVGVETHFVQVEGGDHQILTTEKENVEVRYALEPLLKRVFNIQQQNVPETLWQIVFPLVSIVTLIVVILYWRRRKTQRRSFV